MPYVGVRRGEALKVRKRTLRLSAGVVCCLPPIFKPSLERKEKLPQKVGRKEKLAEKIGRREIYPPVPPPSIKMLSLFSLLTESAIWNSAEPKRKMV